MGYVNARRGDFGTRREGVVHGLRARAERQAREAERAARAAGGDSGGAGSEGGQNRREASRGSLRDKLLPVLLLLLCFTVGAEAADLTFTAVQRGWGGNQPNIGSFNPHSTVTITVSTSGSEVVVEMPGHFFEWQTWPPDTALMFNNAEARRGDCGSVQFFYGDVEGSQQHCIGKLKPTVLPNGRARFQVPKAWFLNAALYPYRIQERYDTCVASGGEIDTWYEKQGCPPAASGPGSEKYVGYPWVGWLLRVQMSPGIQEPEFMFLTDTPAIRASTSPEVNPEPELRPAPEHYGELEWIYSWVKAQLDEPDLISPPESPCP